MNNENKSLVLKKLNFIERRHAQQLVPSWKVMMQDEKGKATDERVLKLRPEVTIKASKLTQTK